MQIGPRIRVGGTLGKIGEAIKPFAVPALASLALPGIGGLVSGALGSLPGAASVAGAASKLGSIPGIGSAASWLTGNGGKNALGLLQGVNAASTQRKSNNLANDALATQQGIWDANAPLREAGRSGMLNPAQGISARIAAVPRGPNAYAPQTPQLAPVAPPRLLNRGV